MTTDELIEELRRRDPTGKANAFMNGGANSRKPGALVTHVITMPGGHEVTLASINAGAERAYPDYRELIASGKW